MAVSFDDLLGLLGAKEAQIFDLARENNRLRQELQKAAAKPTPANVIPFPPAGVTDVKAE